MNRSRSDYLREAAEATPLPLSRSKFKREEKAPSLIESDADPEGMTTNTHNSLVTGLGINFYDNKGDSRRSVLDLSPPTQSEHRERTREGEDAEAEADIDAEKETRIGSEARTRTITRSPTHGRGTPRAQYLQADLPYLSPFFSKSPLSLPNTTRSISQQLPSPEFELRTPKLLTPLHDPDWDHDSPLDLIEKYLEHNYREQAESFVRIASRETPARTLSASTPGSPGSRSRLSSSPSAHEVSPSSEPGELLFGLGIASKVDTPSPPSPVEIASPNSDNETFSQLTIFNKEDEYESPILRSISTNLRLPGTQASTAILRRRASTSSSSSSSNPARQPPSRVQQVCEIYNQRNASNTSSSGFSPLISVSSKPTIVRTPTNTASRLHTSGTIRVPFHSKPTIIKRNSRPSATPRSASTPSPRQPAPRGPEYFTREERHQIARLVHATARNCERHTNCKDCIDLEYAYYENKFLPRNMDPEQRQKIINNNRSLRNIKNELESLAEHGAISDDAYETIMSALPAESSLGGSARSNPTPVQAQAVAPAPAPTSAFNNMSLNEAPPPAYTNPSGPPSLPTRAPSAPLIKPEIARATALYRYTEPDDCTFEPGDQIAVHEYMNNDWWLGRNLRTGKEGVFPVNYVQVLQPQGPPNSHGAYSNEKASYSAYQVQQQNQGPPPPGPSNPYNSSVPPMAVAEEPSKPGKGGEMGKKFGKKLGNAAIFGAGATIGGNIVNSIF
ncbi:hypothetical protein WAI453_001802 [Rhynchosporium graminicola]